MNEGNKVAEEGRGHGQRPYHVFLVPPVVDVDDLLDAALLGLPRARRRRRLRHQRLEAEGANGERGDHAGQEPQRVGQLE